MPRRFDFAFLKSRATILGLPFPYQPFIYGYRRRFRRIGLLTTRNPMTGKPKANLDHVVDFFGLQQKKTAIYPASTGRRSGRAAENRELAMKKLVEHCVSDVEMKRGDLLEADQGRYRLGLRRKK